MPETLRRVQGWLRASAWGEAGSFREIIVVDDGSRDETARLAEEFAAANSEVRVLRNPGNRGKGFAVRHGMLEARGEWRLFSDADLSVAH